MSTVALAAGRLQPPGRNDPCGCGSGKKYKKCCGLHPAAPESASGSKPAPVLAPERVQELVAQLKTGHASTVEEHLRELMRGTSGSALLWTLLAQALRAQGKDAVAALRQAAALQPDNAQAYTNLGNALQDAGELEEALRAQRRALSLNPGYAEAHNNMGSVLTALGRSAEAVESFLRAATLAPGFALAHVNLGNVLKAQGLLAEAVESYVQALSLEPRAELCRQVAELLRELGRLEESATAYRRGLELEPEDPVGWECLSYVLHRLGHNDQAVEACERALAVRPSPSLYTHLGTIEVARNRPEAAEHCVVRALELDPDFTSALVLVSELRVAQGQLAEAELPLRRAVEVNPRSPEAWAALGRFARTGPAGDSWRQAAQRLLADELSPRREILLRGALGRYCDEVGEFEQAFAHYRRANELSRQINPPYEREAHSSYVDRVVAHYDREWLGRNRRSVAPGSERAVLIVGMWRSGTTLAEQILASHPAAFGAGEVPFFKSVAKHYESAAFCGGASAELLAELADEYLGRLQSMDGAARRVVDKMASNFLHLGLVQAALPDARIIHMQRDPLDTCLSIYFQDLAGAHRYATDLEDLAHHYRDYLRLMQHWRRTLPAAAILEVPYEALIEDQEAWSRRMLEFIGLDWDPRCLEFQHTARAVLTSSKWQVRRALYRSSVGRWRHYEPFLGPLLSLRGAQGSAAGAT
jgi:tetratricopeptide (TPR) repeat protein